MWILLIAVKILGVAQWNAMAEREVVMEPTGTLVCQSWTTARTESVLSDFIVDSFDSKEGDSSKEINESDIETYVGTDASTWACTPQNSTEAYPYGTQMVKYRGTGDALFSS